MGQGHSGQRPDTEIGAERMTPEPGLTWRPLSPFGAEVELHQVLPLREGTRDALKNLFLQQYFLLFRGITLSKEEQELLSSYLGSPLDYTEKQYVSNTRPDGLLGSDELVWHSDLLYAPDPYRGIGLYALDVVPGRTSTCFANAVRAEQSLPHELREVARGRRAVSYQTLLRGPAGFNTSHEVLSHHPETHETLVFVDRLHTAYVEGMTEAESAALLSNLGAYIYATDNVYEHRWYPDDFVIWDNIAVQHSRGGSLSPSEVGNRTLRKVVLGPRSAESQLSGFDTVVKGAGNAVGSTALPHTS
jgi:taurine dioxygenase